MTALLWLCDANLDGYVIQILMLICFFRKHIVVEGWKFSVLKHTRNSVQDFSQRGGDGQMEGAVLVPCSIHGMLDHVAGSIDSSFV